MHQTLFTVYLFKDTAALGLYVIFLVVLLFPVRINIPKRCIGGEIELANGFIDLLKGRELTVGIDIGLEIQRLFAFRKLADIRHIIILLNMFSAPCDSDEIQQFEVVEVQHIEQFFTGALLFTQFEPEVKLGLGTAKGVVDAFDAVFFKRIIPRLGDKCNLIFEIVQTVVYRRCGEHQDFGSDPFFQNIIEQFCIAGFTGLFVRAGISEVV